MTKLVFFVADNLHNLRDGNVHALNTINNSFMILGTLHHGLCVLSQSRCSVP